MGDSVLELRDSSKHFSGVEVLGRVSFALWPGEAYALIGRNDNRMLTLIKIVIRMHQLETGDNLSDDKLAYFGAMHEPYQAGEKGINQELNLLPNLNKTENIFIGCQHFNTRGGLNGGNCMQQLVGRCNPWASSWI